MIGKEIALSIIAWMLVADLVLLFVYAAWLIITTIRGAR